MYLFLAKKGFRIKQKNLTEIVGVSESFLSKVINRKRKCSKTLAYAISKALNSEAEILDYFERID